MLERYFSPADATVLRLDTFEVLDVAAGRLIAGDTPIHLYNYARRGPVPMSSGQQGQPLGSVFDDTALSARVVRLELTLNVRRFRDLGTWMVMGSRVGDVLVGFREEDGSWSGYLLKDGYVSRTGYNVSVGSPVGAMVHLEFRDVALWHDVEEVPPIDAQVIDARRYYAYEVEVNSAGVWVLYHPSLLGSLTPQGVRLGRRLATWTYFDPTRWYGAPVVWRQDEGWWIWHPASDTYVSRETLDDLGEVLFDVDQ